MKKITTSRAEPLSSQLKTSVSLGMEESLIISLGYTFSNLDPYSLASGKRFSMENDLISGKTPIFSFTLDRDRLAVLRTGSD